MILKKIAYILPTYFLLFSLVILPKPAFASTLFTDGFEGGYSNWDSHGLWSIVGTAHTGTSSAKIIGSTSGETILQKNISTLGYENLSLSFWYKIQSGLESTDHIDAQYSTDLSTWSSLVDYTLSTPSGWIQSSFVLPPSAANNPNFQLRFLANLGSSSDDFRLDDLTFSADVIPTPTATPTPTSIPTPTPTITAPTPTPTEADLTPTPTVTPTPPKEKEPCKNKHRHFLFWVKNCSKHNYNWPFIKHWLRYNQANAF